ncbi:NRDE-2, necessary for RNA interference-domain-containing protein [Phaeosphaeria sp. MPI-PUGE-AT-0046c]|nr:NRDE-2, necessary for RNA interference-domain-containing protein [Phaeosphaeria sp. MPI-PUGE-AT-0046c]
MASHIPKFASFRPKPKGVPEPPAERPSRDRPSPKPREGRSDRATSSRALEVLDTKSGIVQSKLYFSDRRGDPDVLRYGTLNRSDVPAYRRIGHGYVLGLSLDQKIDRERSSQNNIYITPATRQRPGRLLTGKHAPKQDTRMLRVVISDGKQHIDQGDDFIPVSSDRKRKRNSSEDIEGETLALDYRGIERNIKQALDLDTQYDSDNEDVSSVSESTRKNSELVRHTRESPQDVKAWLNFIEHQEVMLAVDRSELNENLRQRLADVRIPIYDEALKKVRPEDHTILYTGLLREARRSWNGVKVSSKFAEVLRKHPASHELWLMYLDFVQSNFKDFKYESCRDIFLHCLQSFPEAARGANKGITLHVVIRMTAMVHGAGYRELALAIWQAILEFQVIDRPATETNEARSLIDFEQYWETETPRVGDVGANGWRTPASEDHVPKAAALRSRDTSSSIFEDFQVRETEAIRALRYPGRTTDEVGEDDAFHTIFFTDVKEYLKLIPVSTPSTLIVEAFLCFCGLPPLPRIAEHQRTWWNDPFLSHVSDPACAESFTDKQADLLTNSIDRNFSCDSTSMQTTIDHLFECSFSTKPVRLSTDFVRRVLKLVATKCASDEIFGEYLLAFESRHYPADVVKTAKQLLKARPTSQRLYHAYGLVELRRDKLHKANQVFSMALSMGGVGSHENMLLLHSWVWAALLSDDAEQALWRLVFHTGKISTKQDGSIRPSNDMLQTARVTLSDVCEKALLREDYPTAVLGTSLIALLVYLSTSENTEASLAVHRGLSQWFTSHNLSTSPYAELNAQATARFLTYHASKAAIVKPATIRLAMEPLIALFPNNTKLLTLYAANEARFAIDDRVRGIMHHNALQSSDATSVAGWSFAIHYETLRGDVAASTSHSIRALYKRATNQDSSGAHSPILWTSYLRFELSQLQLESARTTNKKPGKDGLRHTWESRMREAKTRLKETVYAGWRSVPWCKDFIFLAFTDAKGVFDEQELWKVYSAMQEKELRIYVELV